jgi:hypothetical protein
MIGDAKLRADRHAPRPLLTERLADLRKVHLRVQLTGRAIACLPVCHAGNICSDATGEARRCASPGLAVLPQGGTDIERNAHRTATGDVPTMRKEERAVAACDEPACVCVTPCAEEEIRAAELREEAARTELSAKVARRRGEVEQVRPSVSRLPFLCSEPSRRLAAPRAIIAGAGAHGARPTEVRRRRGIQCLTIRAQPNCG